MLFLGYTAQRIGRTPSALTVSDLDAPMVSTSSTTSRPSAAIPPAHATSVSPPSGPSCATPRYASQPCCPSRNASLRFPSNASTGPSSATCPARKSPRSSTLPTGPPGADSATPSSSPCSTTPAPASPRSPVCTSPTCFSNGRPPRVCGEVAGAGRRWRDSRVHPRAPFEAVRLTRRTGLGWRRSRHGSSGGRSSTRHRRQFHWCVGGCPCQELCKAVPIAEEF